MTSTSEPVLIGIDGGASGVRAIAVRPSVDEGRTRFTALAPAAERSFDTRAFEPVALDEQLRQRDGGRTSIGAEEAHAARERVNAIASVVIDVARSIPARRVLVGACMAGLKSADGRGIVVLRNGPRIPALARRLEDALQRAAIDLVRPIGPLLSDGEACALGEELALEGKLHDVENAYYLGGGTGLAEAFKLSGRIVGMDELAGRVPKAWQLCDARGVSFEERIGLRAVNARWRERAPGSLAIEQAARAGDERARESLRDLARALAELVHARFVACGSSQQAPATPIALERVVLGQRLGGLVADATLDPWLRDVAEEKLAQLLVAADDAFLARAILDGRRLRRSFLVTSTLRLAPAIGAAARAWNTAESTRSGPR